MTVPSPPVQWSAIRCPPARANRDRRGRVAGHGRCGRGERRWTQMGRDRLRIGLASPRVAATREAGLATVERFLAEAASQGVAIVCFPETYLPGYRGLDFNTPPRDQDAQERTLRAVCDVARKHRVAVIMPMEWESPT